MFLFFDTETTGVPKNYKAPASDLNNWPRLVQLGYLLYDQHKKLIAAGDYIIKPNGFTIPTESSNIHGITTERALNEGKELTEVLSEIAIHIKKSDYLIAHNMAFDEKILGAELLRSGFSNIIEQKTRICTMQTTTEFCAIPGPYGFKWPKLSELHIKLFGNDFDGAHSAFADIEATARCFWKLIGLKIIEVNLKNRINNDTNFNLEVALDIYFSGKYYDGEDNRFRLLYDEYIENEKLGAFKEEHILKHNIDIIYSNILVPFRKGILWGLSDIKKKFILSCDYDEILFHESGFKVKKNSTWKYLNKSDILINNFQNDQKLKIEPLKKSEKDFFDCILKSSEGLSAVRIGKVHQGKWGFVDLQNNIIVPIIYDAVEDFSEGISAVRIGNKCGFVNNKGTPITELIYDYLDYGPDGCVLGVTSFKNGYAGVCINKKWGFIDRNGRTVVNNLYNEIRQFSDGLAAAEKEINNDEYLWGFVNEHGVEVIQCIYSEVGDFQNGLAPVTSYNKDEKDVMRIFKMGFINKNGDIVIPFIYDKLKPFCEGIAVAKLPSLLTREEISDVSWGRKSPNISKMSRTGFIDKNGTTVIPFEYIDADDFSEGFAMVRKKPGRWCYIDKNNREVFSKDFHNANPFKNGFAKVQKLGFDWGYIDINGNEFWEDSIEQIREAIDVALRMNYLIQFKYQKSEIFNSGEISFRTIKPHGFEKIGKSLCVKGHCYLRGADRTFSLERISELIIDPDSI